MGQITENNLIVSIDKVKPNNYNLKLNYQASNDNRLRFEKLKRSLTIHGQMDPIKVREIFEDWYEIINGYHIWMAMKELGFKEIEIKNFGKISREEAIKKSLCLEELKIPLDVIGISQLLKKIKELDIDLKGFPYSKEEIENRIKLLEFDWSQYENQGEIEINKQLGLLNNLSFVEEELEKGEEPEVESEVESETESITESEETQTRQLEFFE